MRRLNGTTIEYTHFHLFCGVGGGARGFNNSHARVGKLRGKLRCLGGIDNDAAAIRDFDKLAGVKGTCRDLFSRQQYIEFNDDLPPEGWEEAQAHDLLIAAGGECPDIVFLSPPCKGFSGLLNKKSAKSRKYQALNLLVPRGIGLMLEAFAHDLPSLIIMENVPRIATRGGILIDVIRDQLAKAGYAVSDSFHDVGEVGGLAQHRKRYLLVARLKAKVQPFLYEPPAQQFKTIGDVIGHLPLPDAELGGPMHRCPRLQWRTWLRLALVEAGSDWRSLNALPVEDGHLKSIGIMQGAGLHAVIDPRSPRDLGSYEPYGVVPWGGQSHTVTSQAAAGSGPYSVADPRLNCDVEDRQGRRFNNVYRVTRWDGQAGAVTSGSGPTSGGQAVADPRVGCKREGGSFSSAKHYGVVGWNGTSDCVNGHAKHDNGAFSVADPRVPAGVVGALPGPKDRLDPVPVIIALDGTWHRPFTTLELAALQGLVSSDDSPLLLDGAADTKWRGRIGNMVPPPAAQAIGETMLTTLLLQAAGTTFMLSALPIWVQPFAAALAIDTDQNDALMGIA